MLGIWIQQSEGAKFWLAVMNELKHRGVEDILIAVIDGLKGFPEAITAVFPMVVRLQHRVFKSLKQNACTNSETLRNVLPLPILEGPIHNPFWSAITWERDAAA